MWSSLITISSVVTPLIFGLIFLVVGMIVVRQSVGFIRDRRQKTVVALWRPLFAQSVYEIPASLPRIRGSDALPVLYLWNHLHESIRGVAKRQLNEVAHLSGLDLRARQFLQSRNLRKRLLAIATLGHLGDRSVWGVLSGLAKSDNPFLSFVAARALMQIDPKEAIAVLTPLIAVRTDWSPLKIMGMLKEAGEGVEREVLAQIFQTGPSVTTSRLIRFFASTHSSHVLPILRQLIEEGSPPDEEVAACLFVFGETSNPKDLPLVRAYLEHPTWYVRVQAAAALGKLGVQEDEARLIHLLEDEQWWVRYRAAEALASLPSMTFEKLEHLLDETSASRARDVLAPFLYRDKTRWFTNEKSN